MVVTGDGCIWGNGALIYPNISNTTRITEFYKMSTAPCHTGSNSKNKSRRDYDHKMFINKQGATIRQLKSQLALLQNELKIKEEVITYHKYNYNKLFDLHAQHIQYTCEKCNSKRQSTNSKKSSNNSKKRKRSASNSGILERSDISRKRLRSRVTPELMFSS